MGDYDDWFNDDESWEGEEEGKPASPTEKQCMRCLHWIPFDAVYCPWCGSAYSTKA